MSFFDKKNILITGGTGSFGKKFVHRLIKTSDVARVIVFSRDEMKQWEMQNDLRALGSDLPVEYQLGDVRDFQRVLAVTHNIDIIVHAAATKIVPSAEWNPYECVKTNILGANNIIEAANLQGVDKVVALSTDKASDPINLYGATKLASDKLFIASNYSHSGDTIFSIVRYGNVLGSRGSVVPYFQGLSSTGIIPITDLRMTRFIITLGQAIDLVELAFQQMRGGEIFVKKNPSVNIQTIAEAVAPKSKYEIIGIRPGEKLHEQMIGIHDARMTREFDNHYRIYSAFADQSGLPGQAVDDNFSYNSEHNDWWLDVTELKMLIENISTT